MSNEIIEAFVVAIYDDNSGYSIISVHPTLGQANDALRSYNKDIEGFSAELGSSSSYDTNGKLRTLFLNSPDNAFTMVSKCTIEFID